MFGHKQSLVEYDKEILENLDIAFSGLYLHTRKTTKNGQIQTILDKYGQIRTLRFCEILYLPTQTLN